MTDPLHQWMTLAFVVLMALVVIAYDIFVSVYIGESATISRALLRFSLEHQLIVPILAFAAGVIFGHIFLPQHIH